MNKFVLLMIIFANISFILNFPEKCEEYNKGHGDCSNDKKYCNCTNEYATKEDETDTWCNYKRKKQLNYFLIEAIAAFGAGHFYAENYKYAVPKVIFWILSWSFIIAVRVLSIKKGLKDEINLFFSLLALLFTIGMIIWYAVDITLIGENRYYDGNGVGLLPW